MADFFIKQGDLLPVLTVTLEDGDGNPVNLTGATVVFNMKPFNSATLKINRASATPDPDQTANTGQCTYTWAGTDTDTIGRYLGEFEATFGGKKESFPNYTGGIIIEVKDDLG